MEGDGFTQERAGSPFRSAPAMALCGLLFSGKARGETHKTKKSFVPLVVLDLYSIIFLYELARAFLFGPKLAKETREVGILNTHKGKLIVIEGLDGSGKATQSELLCINRFEVGDPVRKISFPIMGSPPPPW